MTLHQSTTVLSKLTKLLLSSITSLAKVKFFTFMEDRNAYLNVPVKPYETGKNWRPRLLDNLSSIM